MGISLVELLILDWYDGPLEAFARGDDGGSYLVRLVGEPPITARSTYEVRRLRHSVFSEAVKAVRHAGGGVGPVIPWIEDDDARATLEATLDELAVPVDNSRGSLARLGSDGPWPVTPAAID